MKSNKFPIWKIVLIHIFFISLIVLDIVFKGDIFENNISFTIFIQKHSNKIADYIFLIFCNLVHPVTVSIISIIYYVVSTFKIDALIFILNLNFISYISSILKIIYHDPRPYWIESQIEAKECYMEFGNPSGHSLAATFLIGTIWYECFLKWKAKEKTKILNNNQIIVNDNYENLIFEDIESKKKTTKKCSMIFLSIGFLIILILICYGRIYLGMHSYDQVFLGILYGLYFFIIYFLVLKSFFKSMILLILKKNIKARESLSLCSFAISIKFFVIYAISLAIPIICLEFLSGKNQEKEIVWLGNIEIWCNIDNKNDGFSEKCFVDTGIIGFIFGIIFGLISPFGECNPSLFIGTFDSTLIEECPERISFKKSALRSIIALLGCFIWLGIFHFIPHGSNIFLKFFVNMNLGSFVSGLSLIILVQYLICRCGLENQSDIIHFKKLLQI